METKIKVKFNRTRRKLIVEVDALEFRTPWERDLIGEVLTSINEVLEINNQYKFVFFKDDKDSFGWKSIKKESAVKTI